MDETFNPYAEWLGLPAATDRPDHYTLLGLPPFESDPTKIKQAADKAVARVRSFRPGDKARFWAGLLDELDAVRKCLGDAEAKNAYDEQLKQGGPATAATTAPAPMPEQPRYGPAGPAPDTTSQEVTPPQPLTGDPSLYAPGFVDAQQPSTDTNAAATTNPASGGPLPVRPPGRLPMSRDDVPAAASMQSDVDPMAPVAIGAPTAAVDPMAPMVTPAGAAIAYGAGQPSQPIPQAASNNPIPVATATATTAPAGIVAEDKTLGKQADSNKTQLLYAGIGAVAALALGIAGLVMFWPDAGENNGANNVATSKPADDPYVDDIPSDPLPVEEPEISQPPEITPEPEPEPEPEPAKPDPDPEITSIPDPPTPEPEPEPEPPIVTPPVTPEPPIPEPEPEPQPEPEPEMQPLTPAERAELGKAMVAARKAMGDRDLPTVEKNLARATELARTDEQKAKLDRLNELLHYVKEFWTSVDEAYVNLKPSTTIEVGTSEAAIVEVTQDTLVLRFFGTNRRIPRNDMPSGLAMAIANNWFDNDPANKVVKGALLLVDPNGRPDEARELWKEAQAAGVDIADLMPVIDDKYEF